MKKRNAMNSDQSPCTRISVRLDAITGQALADFAARHHISKAEAVRRELQLLLKPVTSPKSPYELGKHLFGRHASERTDGSVNVSKYVREAIRAKHAKSQNPSGVTS